MGRSRDVAEGLMRTAAIWVFGLLGSGILGLLVGDSLSPHGGGGVLGFTGAALAFACARLWLGSKKPAAN